MGGGWLSYPPPRRWAPRGELQTANQLHEWEPGFLQGSASFKNPRTFPTDAFSRLLGVGPVWWVDPLSARSRACRLGLSLVFSRLGVNEYGFIYVPKKVGCFIFRIISESILEVELGEL